jgi:hypothetical protein
MIVVPSLAEIESGVAAGDDDSFLPLADFLTLLSLAFIYAALMFSRPMVPLDDVGTLIADPARNGQGVPLDPALAYVAVLHDGDKIAVRVVVPDDEQTYEWSVIPNAIVVDEQIGRISKLLDRKTPPKGVIIFLAPDESRPASHQLAIELARRLEGTYPVRLLF